MPPRNQRSHTKGLTPIAANETTAAALMDMTVAEFRSLVDRGLLPRGREIAAGFVRWSVDDLRAIANGNAADSMSDVKW